MSSLNWLNQLRKINFFDYCIDRYNNMNSNNDDIYSSEDGDIFGTFASNYSIKVGKDGLTDGFLDKVREDYIHYSRINLDRGDMSRSIPFYEAMKDHPRFMQFISVEVNELLENLFEDQNQEIRQILLENAVSKMMIQLGYTKDEFDEFLDFRRNRKSARKD